MFPSFYGYLAHVGTAHQLALSVGGLIDYVMHAPRLTVVSANKEGITSLTGIDSIPKMVQGSR